MTVIKVNKSQLSTSTNELVSKVTGVNEVMTSLSGVLKSIPSHSEFGSLVSKASMIASSIEGIYTDLEHVSTNMNTYITSLMEIDNESLDASSSNEEVSNAEATTTITGTTIKTNDSEKKTTWSTSAGAASTLLSTGASKYYSSGNSSSSSSGNYTYSYSTGPTGTVVYSNNNFSSNKLTSDDYNVPAGGKYNYDGIEKFIETVEGVTVTLPAGLGSVHSYMGWQCITAVDSRQYKLREAAGMNFDEEGFAKIGDRYVVATTTTFGNVGDYIDVYQEDGTVIKCIIGDIKSQRDAGCNQWGHDNGHCVVEFVVDKKSWYGSPMHSNPGTSSCHPEWNKNITKIVNKGNYFDLIKKDVAKFDSDVTEDNTSSDTTLVTV